VRRFLDPSRLWPAGVTMPHVYVLPDLASDVGLRKLVHAARRELAGFPVAPVTDRWLHATVQRVEGKTAAEVSDAERAEFDNTLRERLTQVPAFTLTAGPALVTASGVMLDLDGDLPGEPWHRMATAVRDAIRSVFGAEAVSDVPGVPHLSLGYGTADTDSGPIQGRLRSRVRPARATLSVPAVYVCDVVQDPELSEYRWTVWERIPLA
jgi:hypothetical protein